MNQRHPLDEMFNQHLRDASAPVPEDMWSRIAKARQQKRRRLLIIWSSLGSASLIMAAALWMLTGSAPELGSFPLSSPETDGRQTHPTTTVSTISPQVAETAITTEENFNTNPDRENSMLSVPPSKNATQQPLKLRNTAQRNRLAISANLPTRQLEPATLAPATVVNTPPEIDSANPSVKTTPQPDIIEERPDPARVAGPHQRQRFAVVNTLPEKGFLLAEQAEIKLFANHAPRCADFAAPFFRLDLEVLGGPAYAYQTLKAKSSESIPHLQQRQRSESAGVSFAGGFRLAASSSVGLGLRTGLMYTEINDRFTFNVGSRMDVSVIFGPNGEIIDRDTVYTAGYEDTRRNRLRFVEIPLLLGYERQWGKLRVGVNAGAFLNLHFGARGAIYSPATAEPIDFGQQGDRDVLPIFEQQATAAWYAGVSLAYNLHSRYSIIAEPYFKTYPKALSSSAYDLQQNYWLTGMQLGMRMRL